MNPESRSMLVLRQVIHYKLSCCYGHISRAGQLNFQAAIVLKGFGNTSVRKDNGG